MNEQDENLQPVLARAFELTGGTTHSLSEALDQWELEREALAEQFDENQAFALLFRRFDVSMTLAERILGEIESQAGIFISQHTRNRISLFLDELKKVQLHREHGREMVLNANERAIQQRAAI